MVWWLCFSIGSFAHQIVCVHNHLQLYTLASAPSLDCSLSLGAGVGERAFQALGNLETKTKAWGERKREHPGLAGDWSSWRCRVMGEGEHQSWARPLPISRVEAAVKGKVIIYRKCRKQPEDVENTQLIMVTVTGSELFSSDHPAMLLQCLIDQHVPFSSTSGDTLASVDPGTRGSVWVAASWAGLEVSSAPHLELEQARRKAL